MTSRRGKAIGWRPGSSVAVVASALAVVALTLAGCGASTEAVRPPAGPPRTSRPAAADSPGARRSPLPARPAAGMPGSCPEGILRLRTVRLSRGFDPTAAYECWQGLVTIPGRGQWLVEDERQATGGLHHLLRALRRPNQPPPPAGVACAADAIAVPPFVLVAGSRVVRPRVPTDQCRQPQAAALSALRQLPWTLVHRQLLSQVQAPAELVSGCPSAFKDLFDLDAARFVPAGTGLRWRGSRSPITICRYRDPDSALNHPDGRRLSGAGIEVGAFSGWTRQRGPAAARLLRGLSHGRQTTTCSRQHRGFATVSGPGVQPDLLVELGGGCDRVLRLTSVPGSRPRTSVEVEAIGQAKAATARRIEALTRPA